MKFIGCLSFDDQLLHTDFDTEMFHSLFSVYLFLCLTMDLQLR